MTSSNTIVALALLKTNWELKRRSYIDNFNFLTAEALRRGSHDLVSAPEVHSALRSHFGIDLPLNTVATLLKRASKQGFVALEHGVYSVDRHAVSQIRFAEMEHTALVAQEALSKDLAAFALKHFELAWTSEDAENAIHGYLADEAIAILQAASEHAYVPLPRHRSKTAKYVLASYVNAQLAGESPHLQYLQMVAEGSALARGVFLPSGGAQIEKFSKTGLYFDTKFLLSALGHAGPSLQAPNAELLRLLGQAGADLHCFSHTLDEVRSVLIGCARGLRAYGYPGYGPVFDHFLGQGASESDVLLLANRLEGDLHDMGVVPRAAPAPSEANAIDEQGLEQHIRAKVNYLNANALQRDIASIAGVIRLRGNAHPGSLEKCGALFVTTNRPLVSAVLEFTRGELPEERVAPATLDADLTNLVWLRQPAVAPDLPRRRLIATLYAALQPTDEFRRRFLKEIDILARSGKYSERDVYMLRNSLEARRIAMDLTAGDEDAFTAGTVTEVLEVLQMGIRREADAKADAERERADREKQEGEHLKAEIDERAQKERERVERRDRRAEDLAAALSWAAACLTTILLSLAYYGTLAERATSTKWVRVLWTALVALVTVGTWVSSTFTVASLRERLARALRKPAIQLLKWFAGE